jgi:hypothetical protein
LRLHPSIISRISANESLTVCVRLRGHPDVEPMFVSRAINP